MNVTFLINNYFKDQDGLDINVFDPDTLNKAYQDVIKALTSHLEIETSVLQALSYCFYEMLDNVHIHSGRPIGTAITRFDAKKEMLQVLIADDGKGIRQSLAENPQYASITEAEALRLCLKDSITDGKGMGFGLYATSRLIDRVGIKFILHSGHHKLIFENGVTSVIENGLWDGTLIYMEISTSKDINPNEVVDNRTDAAEEYNEAFIDTETLDVLWSAPLDKTIKEFSLLEFGTDFGTRDMGKKIQNKFKSLLNDKLCLVLDFTGVNVVSNSFADECIAKLLLDTPLSELKQGIAFKGLNPIANRSILVALQRRLNTLKINE